MKKKLLYIATNINNTGGVSRILSVKLNYLVKTFNYDIYIINTKGSIDSLFYDFNENIILCSLGKELFSSLNFFSYKRALQAKIDHINPDVIINCDNGLKGALLTYLVTTKTPLIYERHCSKHIKGDNFSQNLKIWISQLLLKYHIHKYRKFVVLNDDEIRDWECSNVRSILNPLWMEIPINGSTLDNKIVVAVGNHTYKKGYDTLLKIWKKLIRDYPDWRLKIYGAHDENLDIEKMTREFNVNNSVDLCEPVKDINQIYLNASIFVNTSSQEEFGLALMEAMAFGIPAMAFENTTGPRTLIANTDNGFLIKEQNMTDYATKLKMLMASSSLRKKMGAKAKKSLIRFDMETIMNKWDNLFQSIS